MFTYKTACYHFICNGCYTLYLRFFKVISITSFSGTCTGISQFDDATSSFLPNEHVFLQACLVKYTTYTGKLLISLRILF